MRFASSVEQLAYAGDDRAAEELDRGHALVVRDPSDGVVQVEPAQAERADDCGDPIGDGLGGADVHRAVVDLGEELLVGRRAPAALARRPLELLLVVGPLDLDRLAIALGDEAERVQPDRQLRLSVLHERSLVELDVGCEALGSAGDDRQHQRQAEACGAYDRFRAAPDANPGRDVSLGDRRADGLARERRAEVPRPGDGLLT